MSEAETNNVNENEESERLPFDTEAVRLFQTTIIHACNKIPELRQVSVTFDWIGSLNKSAVTIVAGDSAGPIEENESTPHIYSLLQQTLKVVGHLTKLLDEAAGLQVEGELGDTEEETDVRQSEEEGTGDEGCGETGEPAATITVATTED
jgi:hypothetical protein